MIRHFLNPPNWFTSASIFCSVYALSLIMGAGEVDAEILKRACVLVIFGGVFDLLDGRVARMTNRYTEFGVQLDSIADIVGFGVAPALIAWSFALKDLGPFGVAITFWYVLCAAFRLARFNVNTVEKTWDLAGHSQGLTSTMSGGCLVTMVWVANGYLIDVWNLSSWFVGGVVAMLGLLMVSSIPFRTFKDLRDNKRARRFLAVALSCCLAGAVVLDPSMWWGVGAFLYMTVGVADGIIVAVHRRMVRRALMIEDIEEAWADEDEEYVEVST